MNHKKVITSYIKSYIYIYNYLTIYNTVYTYVYTQMSKILSAIYYQENKETLQINAQERYQNNVSWKKRKNQQYECEWHKSLPEEWK